MSNVFVINTNKQPLHPVHPGRARILLSTGRAAVWKRYPFTIVMKDAMTPAPIPLRLKIDPGSKITGLAIVNNATGEVVFGAELEHRGQRIKARLDARRSVRRTRHQRQTRYRKPRVHNRIRRKGRLPPSLESRIANILTWVRRLQKICPIMALSQELVKFDTQLMEHPEIEGVEYQQGDLAGYEVREYLLEKWERTCAYCGKRDVPLQVEHITPRAHGGTNRLSNLTLACEQCNQAKGTQDIKTFLASKPEVLKRLLAQAGQPLKDASAVNATRWALYERLKMFSLPVECGTGGRTKYNRVTRNLPKTHWLDAACVGASTPDVLDVAQMIPLAIKATGHGSRQMCVPDAFGFPSQHKARHKFYLGYQTGDLVKAILPNGKHAGTYEGRIAIRFRPSFRLGKIDVHPKYLRLLQQCDGYSYEKGEAAIPPTA